MMVLFRSLFLCLILGLSVSQTTEGQSDDELNVPGLTDIGNANNSDAAETEKIEADTTVFSYIRKGGIAMWILGFFSLALIGLAVYCFLDFRPENFHPEEKEQYLKRKIAEAKLDTVLEEAAQPDATTLAKMCGAVVHYVTENGYTADDHELHRNLIAEAGQKHNRKRARLVNYLTVIAQAAPMAGLLGTVFGMIKAFASLSKKGNNPGELASSISEALVTTATGLIIALPAIFLYFMLRDRLEELVSISEEKATENLSALRQAAFAATLAEDEALEARENVYDNSVQIEYED